MAKERVAALMQAYHDGELSILGRWRAERRIARDPEARRELQNLATLTELFREVDAEGPAPDLWERIGPGLRERGGRRDVEDRSFGRARAVFAPGWLGAGVAVAAAALALAIGLGTGDASERGAIRWLDSRGLPMMVLQDDGEATIIWAPEGPGEVSRRPGRAFI